MHPRDAAHKAVPCRSGRRDAQQKREQPQNDPRPLEDLTADHPLTEQQEQHKHAGGAGKHPGAGIMDEKHARNGKINLIGLAQIAEVAITKTARQGQRVGTMLLQTAAVEFGGIVERRVIGLPVANECKIQSGEAVLLEDGHVRIVRQVLVNLVSQRRAGYAGGGFGQFAYQFAILRAGFEHLRDAGVSSRFEIQHEAHIPGPGMLIHEGRRAQQAVFFAVGEQKDDVVLERRAGLERVQRFQQRGHSGTVVARAGSRGNGIVMRHKHHRAASAFRLRRERSGRSLQAGDNVLHGARHGKFLHVSCSGLQLGIDAKTD